jgi:ferrous iron transport protein B
MTTLPLVALVGNPNAGKSALFNALTGARQKVGNYPGVTVERKSGRMFLPDGRPIEVVDLPGTYSLTPSSPDESVTRDVIVGRQEGERLPSALVIVLDSTNLDNHLRFALQLIDLGLPTVVALNMVDLAEREGLVIDLDALSRELGVPVVRTVAVRKRGLDDLCAALTGLVAGPLRLREGGEVIHDDSIALQRKARAIAAAVTVEESPSRRWTHRIDAVALHPIFGPIILAGLLFLMFQAVFSWSEAPVGLIEALFAWMQGAVEAALPDGLIRSAISNGVIAGVGSVVAFLPLILILFFFILILEASGYMVRAAFLMDRIMARVGLSGRAFIPLLSSFACAIPGIMATRTIDDPKERLTTILIAPLMTCSARLPVYAVIIAAFIPNRSVGPGVGLQGLVLFTLYITGIIGAMLAALVIRRTIANGTTHGFLMEMPKYQAPIWRDVALGLWQRCLIFLKRAGTTIMTVTIVLWALLSFPIAPAGQSQVQYSVAGRIASVLTPLVRPVGFNHEIALSLIPAMAAREVAVSSLATVYAIDSADEEKTEASLVERLRSRWPLPTALAFLAWFVFAPQCLSTIAVTRRETNGWKWPGFMLLYLFGLAYLAAGATYWSAVALGL